MDAERLKYFLVTLDQGVLGPFSLDQIRIKIQKEEVKPQDQIIPAHPEYSQVQSVMDVLGQSTRKFPRAYMQLQVLVNDGNRVVPTHAIQIGQRGSLVLVDSPIYTLGEEVKIHLRSETLHRPVLTTAKVVGTDNSSHLALYFESIKSDDEQFLANVIAG